MYPGADNGPNETYMMPGTGPNPQVTLLQPLEGVDYMTSEIPPEVIYDQGLYYPAANYYGYICTGLEPQSEWDNHHRFFGLDGQELHYSAIQTESSPYAYYPPAYGYAQSSYNPYNPYIPGAVMGVDGPIIGTQQYFSNPSYQLPGSSHAAYIPTIVQPNSDVVANISVTPSVLGTVPSVPSGQAATGSKNSQPRISSNGGATSQGSSSRIQKSESLQTSFSAASMNFSSNKESSSLGSFTSGNVSQMTQGRTGMMQGTDHFFHGSVSSDHNPSRVSPNNLLSNFGSSVRDWTPLDRIRPRFQFNSAVKNGKGSLDILGEQNRGPRTNKSKGQFASAVAEGAQVGKSVAHNAQEAIVIGADQYNKDDLPVDYPNAKFFVIKSYSEDDVHKSIKYNVWSSTPNGNKRLHSAYEDAQRVSAGKPRNCPIFLFFSVNASGQFCGVAEMIGPVDFDKDMDFWQQDKWTGSFPVKWHIIKDVPNTSFRHIILENNENKPVTNSRDTQEITYVPGINILKIFKSSPLKTSILDDFMFYEERQKVMQEEKSRFTGQSYSIYIPAVVSWQKPGNFPDQNDSADQTAETGDQSSEALNLSVSSNDKQGFDNKVSKTSISANIEHEKNSGDDGLCPHQITLEPDAIKPSDHQITTIANAIKPSDDKKDDSPDQKGGDDVAGSVIKMRSLSIGSGEGSRVAVESTHSDVVTVGSMHIKVNGTTEVASKDSMMGSISVEPKAVETQPERCDV